MAINNIKVLKEIIGGSFQEVSPLSELNGNVGILTNEPIYPFEVAGDIAMSSLGSGLKICEGANSTMGVATLVAGTATINTNKVTSDSRIFLTRLTVAGTLGTSVDVTARVPGTSFTITSNGSVLDTSTVAWLIIDAI